MTNFDIIEYLYTQRYKKGIVPGLSRIRNIYDLLNINIESSKIIHVAGTNGKGSSIAFIKSILEANNKKVAVFTSPHIKNIEERFYFNGSFINFDKLKSILTNIKKIADNYQNKYPYNFITFFEYMTLAFLYWLKEIQPDYVILEVGMGGRFDATNIIDAKYSIITSISLDHVSYLGNNIEKIAFEKAGIIKKDQILFLGNIKQEALRVIKKVAVYNNVLINYTKDKEIVYLNKINNNMLKAPYQINNLKIAISVVENIDPNINDFTIIKGIEKTKWSARFEKISQSPIIIRDVAHNIEGILALKEAIKINYPNKLVITLFSVMKDKDYVEMLKILDDISEINIFCKVNERAETPEILKKLSNKKSIIIEDPKLAYEKIKVMQKEHPNSIILVTGSIFMMEYIS